MTAKRVRSIVIVKNEGNNRDDHDKILKAKVTPVMPGVLGESKNTMVVRVQCYQPWPGDNHIRIRSGLTSNILSMIAHLVDKRLVNYVPKCYQISRITVFTPRNLMLQGSAKELVWISGEAGTPEEYWTDIYVELEITRWSFVSGLPTCFEGCEQSVTRVSLRKRSDVTCVYSNIHMTITCTHVMHKFLYYIIVYVHICI